MRDELGVEKEKVRRLEDKVRIYKRKIKEMQAFHETVKNFMHKSVEDDRSTKNSTNQLGWNEEREPVPSFLKAALN